MARFNLQLFAQKLNTKESVVDYLKSQGQDSSMTARKELAKSLGIKNYNGSYEQNVQMLGALKNSASNVPVSKGAGKNNGDNQMVALTGDVGSKAPSTGTGGNVPPTGTGGNNVPTTGTGAPILGVDQATIDKINSTFAPSDTVTGANAESDAYLQKVKDLAGVTDIVDQATWDALNTPFQMPTAITEAFNYTNGLLQQLSSGRTSYTDQIKSLMSDIQNREKFSYDVDTDTMFQQALASAMGSGKTAMQDTIGQASALTGGYGSTYATTAGNQAYNAYIQDAYANLPEYYQMALEAYQMEGQDMYQQFAMLSEADATEYQRMYDSWSANFSTAQQMYQNAYGEWQDGINNAYNSANLQIKEHGQLFDQVYSAYTATANNAQQLYQNEYNAWADEVAQAQKIASMMNGDYWSNEELTQRKSEHEADVAYKEKALQQDDDQFYASLDQKDRQFATSTAQEQAQFLAKYDLNGDGVVDAKDQEIEEADTDSDVKEPSETQMSRALEAYNTGGDEALDKYVDSLGSVNVESIFEYVYGNEENNSEGYGELPLEQRTFTKSDDTTNWFWGIDNNDEVTDQYGNTYRIDELPENLRKKLTKLKEGESYSAKK